MLSVRINDVDGEESMRASSFSNALLGIPTIIAAFLAIESTFKKTLSGKPNKGESAATVGTTGERFRTTPSLDAAVRTEIYIYRSIISFFGE